MPHDGREVYFISFQVSLHFRIVDRSGHDFYVMSRSRGGNQSGIEYVLYVLLQDFQCGVYHFFLFFTYEDFRLAILFKQHLCRNRCTR